MSDGARNWNNEETTFWSRKGNGRSTNVSRQSIGHLPHNYWVPNTYPDNNRHINLDVLVMVLGQFLISSHVWIFTKEFSCEYWIRNHSGPLINLTTCPNENTHVYFQMQRGFFATPFIVSHRSLGHKPSAFCLNSGLASEKSERLNYHVVDERLN